MKKNKKVGFLGKSILSITDFRIYPHILKTESTLKSVGHFLLLLLIITTIISLSFTVKIEKAFNAFYDEYKELVPEFVLQNNSFDIEVKDEFILKNDTALIVNTDCTFEECVELEQYDSYNVYNNRIFINSDMAAYIAKTGTNGNEEEYAVTTLPFSSFDINYNKETFYDHLTSLKGTVKFRIISFLIIYLAVFAIYGVWKLLDVIVYAFMISIVSSIAGMRLAFKNYIKLASYIITLPYLLEMISILYVGEVNDSLIIFSSMLAGVYIVYAVRAVKLDAFLMIINKTGNTKKTKDGRTVISIDPENDENKSDEANKSENDNSEEKRETDKDKKDNEAENNQTESLEKKDETNSDEDNEKK